MADDDSDDADFRAAVTASLEHSSVDAVLTVTRYTYLWTHE